jgi:hypothetical protein
MDDVVSGAITIPAFKFNNVTYTSIYISSNGFITFGSAPTANNYTPLSSTETYAGCISAFGADLGVYPSTFSPSIMYKTVGNEFIIQWKDFGRYNSNNTVDEYMTFQIRLNTSTNEARVVFGSITITGSSTVYPQIGIRGPNNNFATNVNNRSVISGAGNWYTGSTAGTSNTSTCYHNDNEVFTYPHSGLNWVWTPGAFYTANYSWSPTTGLSNATIANPVANPTSTTAYTVTLNTGSCTSTSTVNVAVSVCTNLEELVEKSNADIFPNPVNDELNINIVDASSLANLKIIDLLGNLVFTDVLHSTNNKINIAHLSSGTYFVNIISNGKNQTQKIMIFH